MRRFGSAVLLLVSLLLAYLALAAAWARVRAVLAGRCRPAGWFDTTYAHCSN